MKKYFNENFPGMQTEVYTNSTFSRLAIGNNSRLSKKNHKEHHTGEKVAFSNLREQRQKFYIN